MVKIKINKLVVEKDENSPTGYTIKANSGSGIFASLYEIHLWGMYQACQDRVRKLESALNKEVALRLKSGADKNGSI